MAAIASSVYRERCHGVLAFGLLGPKFPRQFWIGSALTPSRFCQAVLGTISYSTLRFSASGQ